MSTFDGRFNHLKIPLIEIQTATNNFSDKNIIGKGGFGNIYKGQLIRSGNPIDIIARRMQYGKGLKEFQTEIIMLSSLKHQNLVSIVGFCDETHEKIIVNKFEANGRLDQYLSDPVTLTWTKRLQICLGIARALSYIHYDLGRTFSVIHRNIKSCKVLLGDEWEAKLSGFGLSMMQPAAQRHDPVHDLPYGKLDYMDPACVTFENVTQKSDVYSFGVVLFEVMSGRSACTQYSGEWVLLANLAKSLYENENINDIILPGLYNQMDLQSLKKFSEAAYCCLNQQRAQRPNIDRVVFALGQALELQLAHEYSEHSTLGVEGTSSSYWKWKDLEYLKIGLEDIKLATENFAEKYRIGSGAYGVVYKAELEHVDLSVMKEDEELEDLPRRRSTVAIKYITNRGDTQGEQGFIREIETLSSCRHPNIVSLLGFCYERPHMILVYEHVSNGSLDDYLGSEGKMINLTWLQRINICIDIARGLDYIHTTMDYRQNIIHRDVKSANILLSENWEAKIADFGLSKLKPLTHSASTINANEVAGTKLYLDPEYERTGRLKKESDVYSFGVVVFEILSGTLAYDSIYTNVNQNGLAPIARQHFETGTINEIVDPKLKEESEGKSFTLTKGPNQDSLHTFSYIGYQCLAETQAQRPTMKTVIKELEKALELQEVYNDNLRISFEDIRLATNNFDSGNIIRISGSGTIYKGSFLRANEPTTRVVKRWENDSDFEGEQEFQRELVILYKYKHTNIVGLVGYCVENNEKITVYEYASKGSLDRYVDEASLTWMERLKIGIDVAMGLEFLHEGGSIQAPVIHRDIKSSNILLNDDWKAKISGFGRSIITPINNQIDFVLENDRIKFSYGDVFNHNSGFLTRESDIYTLGVVLLELMCGRMTYVHGDDEDERGFLFHLARRLYDEGKLNEAVIEGIKGQIVPESLTTFQKIAYRCLGLGEGKLEVVPTAKEVVLQLQEAMKFQEDIEIWKATLPRDYKEIIQMSKNPEIYYYNLSNKDLYDVLSKGILLKDGKVCLSLSGNGQRDEMISATTFSYENPRLQKRRYIKKSRFQRVVKMVDTSNLMIQIKTKTQFLSPNVIYGAHLVFKFCEPRKFSSKLMYVNLKYQMGNKTLYAYFATYGEDEWMMIELCRFIPNKKDVYFEVLLESLSRYYCGSGAIYVEGIHFRAIKDLVTLKVSHDAYEKVIGAERFLKSNSYSVTQGPLDYDEITHLDDGEKIFLQSSVNGKKCHMLPANMVLYNSSNTECFSWKSLEESRFSDVAELLSHQVFRIKCLIQTQKLSPDTDYACHLIFNLSQKCQGLQCPVKVSKNRESKYLYFRSPRLVNFHNSERVPKLREDGLMEVIVWEFNSGKKLSGDYITISLKLRCYEGTMSGLIIFGIEFRPIYKVTRKNKILSRISL